MKKKVLYILLLIATLTMGHAANVYAQEDSKTYTTPNGIVMSYKEYTFLKEFYFEGYPDMMTPEDYEAFQSKGFNLDSLEKKSLYLKEDNTRSTSHTTSYKQLVIGKSCTSTYCFVSIGLNWLVNPTIRSYDVIGAYVAGVSILDFDPAVVVSSAGTSGYNYVQSAYNGFGNSVLLPSSGTGIMVTQVIKTSTGGVVLGSYQHAMQNVSLATSQCYNFSLGGYGSVFSFYGNAVGKYDGMAGVDISV